MEHRVGDRRVVRLIRKWLTAGVMEDGRVTPGTVGTPQGAVISPLLANIYLHYVFDLWAKQWRRRHAHGDIIVVRYADDIVVGFEHQADAERFREDMRARMAEFALTLHPGKTRLIEFGRHAAKNRRARGLGKPETFNFLGFTHISGHSGGESSNSSGSLAATGCAPGCRWSKRNCVEGCTRRSMSRERGCGGL